MLGLLLIIIAATMAVSLISIIGIFSLSVKKRALNKILPNLIALASGTMMGGAILHLLPEAIGSDGNMAYSYAIVGFAVFFLLEKILFWRHCHKGVCDTHTFAYTNLIGDGIHNLIDGVVIGATFITNIALGLATTLAVAMHEIPQEIGDFGVLVYAGFSRKKALIANLLTALTAVFGGVLGYFFASRINAIAPLLAFTAGGFIYIASVDLMPELGKSKNTKDTIKNFLVFTMGIVIMALLLFME